jgi:hypothetical protein
MNIVQMPKFTLTAAKLWAKLSSEHKRLILKNVWCSQCKGETTIINVNGKAQRGCLLLDGECIACGGKVGRFVEDDWFV